MNLPENPTPEEFSEIAPQLVRKILTDNNGFPDPIDDLAWAIQDGKICGQFTSDSAVYGYEIENGIRTYWAISGIEDLDEP